MPRLFLAQLQLKDFPEGSEGASEQGMKIAKARRKHGRSYVLNDYFSVGKNIIHEGDKVIQTERRILRAIWRARRRRRS